ncbi:MAG: urea ABC transporter permease subunit UrtB, partial [Candidatus Saccharibacteria bacterium]|nr:urea ABC transporter permease subunit UrtB [Pseudorhodobacter sp.]
MRILFLLLSLMFCTAAWADTAANILTANARLVEKASRQTIEPVITALAGSGDPMAARILQSWSSKALGLRKSDRAFFLLTPSADGYALTDLTGADAGKAQKSEITELKPNAGVRGLIESALVQFTLSDPDPAARAAALTSIARDPDASLLTPLRASIDGETDATLKEQKSRLERLLTLKFDPDTTARIAAIASFGSDLGLDIRGALNPLVATSRLAAAAPPAGANIARRLILGRDLTKPEAYDLLVAAGLAPPRLSRDDQIRALVANLQDGRVGGVALADLDLQSARDTAYTALETAGTVPTAATEDEVNATIGTYKYYEIYAEPDAAVTAAAERQLTTIGRTVAAMQVADLALDGLSLASIYFLAAIGLAITFGVMGVINMAHGEFITMGAYTGFVVQTFIPNYTISLLVAFPLAFVVTFAAGVAMERLVIR